MHGVREHKRVLRVKQVFFVFPMSSMVVLVAVHHNDKVCFVRIVSHDKVCLWKGKYSCPHEEIIVIPV